MATKSWEGNGITLVKDKTACLTRQLGPFPAIGVIAIFYRSNDACPTRNQLHLHRWTELMSK